MTFGGRVDVSNDHFLEGKLVVLVEDLYLVTFFNIFDGNFFLLAIFLSD